MTLVDPEPAPLRQLVLAVRVLADLDVEPSPAGIRFTDPRCALLPWDQVQRIIGPHPADSGVARHRLADWLRLRLLVADLGRQGPTVLRQAARALALPPTHALHPGPDWVQEAVLGGALECGIALLGVLDDPADVIPLPAGVAEHAGIDPRRWWPGVREHARSMGHLAVQRLRRDRGGRQQVLRPVGGVDVPTLLTSPALRRHLARDDGSGMRAVAVPMRSRGWFDLARIDPAFVGAAWSATPEPERGVSVPVLVTADEVGLAPRGDDPLEALQDDVRTDWRTRDVRYR